MEAIPAIDSKFDSTRWKKELDKIIQDVQHDTLKYMLVCLLVCTVVMLGGIIYFPNPVWTMGTVFGMALLAGVVWFIHRWSFLTAGWVMIIGVTITILNLIIGGEFPTAIYLLALPAGLATLLVSRMAGFTIAAFFNLALVLPVPLISNYSSEEKLVLGILIWGAVSMIWVTFRPLVNTLGWAWTGYQTSNALLESAQEFQVRLLQTLEQLKDANLQLTRLNQLAHNLRIMAEEERRIKEQFVATVSHELRTPLNMIIGFCEMITHSPKSYGPSLPPTLLADLKVVLRNSQHLSSLIDDVLDLSQIEAGQMTLVRENVTLASLIEAVTVAVIPLFSSKNLYLRSEIPDDLPEIFCDKKRIREVLLNLLSNAGRFTDQGGVEVRAWRENNDIVVSVSDTGKGLEPDTQEKLFKPFQQLEPSIQVRYGGTGLGLAISKQFIELHDGKIWVESQAGSGTTFFFRLPITPPTPLDPGALRWFNPYQPYEERPPHPDIPEISVPPRLLVVEQGNTLQRLLSRNWGNIDVVGLPTIQSALENNSVCPANLLLINDPQAITHLVNQPISWLPESMPVVLLNLEGNEVAAAELGVQGYLLKPISSQDLLEAIQHLGIPIRLVMLVDDEPDTLQLFSRILTTAGKGYRVLRALNGRQALELLQVEIPDVILLDLTMPEMNGVETIKALKENPALQDIPVILTSARDPIQGPLTSKSLTITYQDGLSTQIILDSLTALSMVFARHGLSADLTPPGIHPD